MSRERRPLAGLDLNLLVSLRALIREGSVTRAAERLGQAQPTMSRSLATLRQAFDDPILVRAGRGMALTPLAESLHTPLERALAAVDRLGFVGAFDPSTAQRRFRVLLPDVAGLFLAPTLVERVRVEAPGVRLYILGDEGRSLQALLDDQVDLVVASPSFEHPELYSRRVGGSVGWSVVVGPTIAEAELELQAWLSYGHVQITPMNRPDEPSDLDRLLERRGLTRSIAVKVAYVASVAGILRTSPYVLTLPTPMAREIARHPDLRMLPHPFGEGLRGLELRMSWHQLHHRDAGLVWLRDLVGDVVAGIVGPTTEPTSAG